MVFRPRRRPIVSQIRPRPGGHVRRRGTARKRSPRPRRRRRRKRRARRRHHGRGVRPPDRASRGHPIRSLAAVPGGFGRLPPLRADDVLEPPLCVRVLSGRPIGTRVVRRSGGCGHRYRVFLAAVHRVPVRPAVRRPRTLFDSRDVVRPRRDDATRDHCRRRPLWRRNRTRLQRARHGVAARLPLRGVRPPRRPRLRTPETARLQRPVHG